MEDMDCDRAAMLLCGLRGKDGEPGRPLFSVGNRVEVRAYDDGADTYQYFPARITAMDGDMARVVIGVHSNSEWVDHSDIFPLRPQEDFSVLRDQELVEALSRDGKYGMGWCTAVIMDYVPGRRRPYKVRFPGYPSISSEQSTACRRAIFDGYGSSSSSSSRSSSDTENSA